MKPKTRLRFSLAAAILAAASPSSSRAFASFRACSRPAATLTSARAVVTARCASASWAESWALLAARARASASASRHLASCWVATCRWNSGQ